MADVTIHGVDEAVLERFREAAASRRETIDVVLSEALAEAAWRTQGDLLQRLDSFRAYLRGKYGELPDSTPGIREERDL